MILKTKQILAITSNLNNYILSKRKNRVGEVQGITMKGMDYLSFVRSAILYWSETWCVRENEMTVLRRTEGTMVRAMRG